jgi:hypothetical protein
MSKKEFFEPKPHNSANIIPIGININDKNMNNYLKSKPLKNFTFTIDTNNLSLLENTEIDKITNFIQSEFSNFLKIISIKKHNTLFEVIFELKSQTPHHHVIIANILSENNKLFFNNLEYGGMILPTELSTSQGFDKLFFINESFDSFTPTDEEINIELKNFEHRKNDILLRENQI